MSTFVHSTAQTRRQSRVVEPGSRAGAGWERRYVRRLILADGTAAFLAALTAFTLRFGQGATTTETLAYSWAVVAMPVVWVVSAALCRAYEVRFLGVGSEEFRRMFGAGLAVIALVGTMSWLLNLQVARGFMVVALPLAMLATVTQRYLLRKSLHRRRIEGECVQHVVAVGHVAGVVGMVERFRRARYHGMEVVGACVPSGNQDAELEALGIPVLGDLSQVLDAVKLVDADTVAVLASPEMDGPALRRLGWALEETRADLVVAPALIEVVGPRIAIRPVCGLPLLHVERPELDGIRRLGKTAVDRLGSVAALAVLLPVFLAIAVAVRLDSRGPVFFRQDRVGRDGHHFTMLKFRTMVVDAESQVSQLSALDDGNGVLFKMRADPRVTRVGRWLRRYSLDEMPQLINVTGGQMSLVGPRPPLPSEVALYEDDVRRRLLVKPGLTGLWQINGRSDLDWDESVRLDLRYVENWSFAFDLMILWKTAAAVLKGRGAY